MAYFSPDNGPASSNPPGMTQQPQRYFRIRLAHASSQPGAPAKTGWWVAHFDGQRVARQMELYPGEPVVLLVAGKYNY